MALSLGSGNIYKPLGENEIRLLRLEGLCLVDLPGNTQDFAIKCSLQTVSLSSEDNEDKNNDNNSNNNNGDDTAAKPSNGKKHRYTALSYCWGSTSSSFRRRVVCNGVVLRVTINLFEALWQLSLDKSPEKKLLWVDAICIHQNDIVEKSLHVRRMGEVFRQASMVLIWLGTGATSEGSFLSNWWGRVSDKSLHGADRRPVSLACKAAKTFFEENAWFRRVWTFQEIVVADNPYVQCGRFCISWEDACTFCDVSSLTKDINNIRETRGHHSLATLLSATVSRKSTVDLDRVYSLLGIYQGTGTITVNYKCLVTDIFAQAAGVMVADTNYLFFISVMLKRLPRISKLNLPGSLAQQTGGGEGGQLVHPFRVKGQVASVMGKSWIGAINDGETGPGVCFDVQGVYTGRRRRVPLDFRSLHPAWTLTCEPSFHTRTQYFPTMLVDGAILGEYVVLEGSRKVWPLERDAEFGTFRPIQCTYVSQMRVGDLLCCNSAKSRSSNSSKLTTNIDTRSVLENFNFDEFVPDKDNDDNGDEEDADTDYGGSAYTLVSAEHKRLSASYYHAAALPRHPGLIFSAGDVFRYISNRHDATPDPCCACRNPATTTYGSPLPANPAADIAPLTPEQRKDPGAVKRYNEAKEALLEWRRRHFRRYWLVVLFGATAPVLLESTWYVHSDRAVFAVAAALDGGHKWTNMLQELADGRLRFGEGMRRWWARRKEGGVGVDTGADVADAGADKPVDENDEAALKGLAELSWVPARFELA